MFRELESKTVLVTGATGLIGQALVKYLLEHTNGQVIAEARNTAKLSELLAEHISNSRLQVFSHDLLTAYANIAPNYIVHTAAPTASAFFVEHPVETIDSIVIGTKNILELARLANCEGTVVLSSLEAYGTPFDSEPLTEDKLGYLDPMALRSSYPEAKRLSEAYITAYANEYNVRAMSVRLAQTFGPGIAIDDGRVFAQFIRAALAGQDIELLSAGRTKRMYISVHDAITAIFTVLLKGTAGQAYNAANEGNFTSIYEMAILVSDVLADGKIKVLTNQGSCDKYLGEMQIYQDTSKLRALGWSACDDLTKMYKDTADYIKTI